jgi:hypothetical protein
MAAVLSAAAGVAAWAWAQDGPGPRPAAKDAGPVSVQSFERQPPIGYLGHPLGTVVRVTGICIDGDTFRAKAYAGKMLLRVEAVNGRKLAEPTDFFFNRADDGVPTPKPGERFDYNAHEYGAFDGVVRTPEKVIRWAGPSFGYRSALEVHKSHPVK